MTFDLGFYDSELRRYNNRFRDAATVQPGEHVLDIGCGAARPHAKPPTPPKVTEARSGSTSPT